MTCVYSAIKSDWPSRWRLFITGYIMKNRMRASIKLFLISALSLSSPLAASGPFTISQVLSAPFASAPVASPTGAKVAWLENEQGKRNVFVAAAPDWKALKVTNFSTDDGQEIGELAWAHDGSYVVFVRGGELRTAVTIRIRIGARQHRNRKSGLRMPTEPR
jgi:hypothetical protein